MAAVTSIKFHDALKGRARQLAEVRRRSSHWILREAGKDVGPLAWHG
jgi:predicted transcriptional regulator